MPEKIILVSRLDGPSEAIVRRVIDDSIHVEKRGYPVRLISMPAGLSRTIKLTQ